MMRTIHVPPLPQYIAIPVHSTLSLRIASSDLVAILPVTIHDIAPTFKLILGFGTIVCYYAVQCTIDLHGMARMSLDGAHPRLRLVSCSSSLWLRSSSEPEVRKARICGFIDEG